MGGYTPLGDKRRVIIGSICHDITLIMNNFVPSTRRPRVAQPSTLVMLQSLLVGIGQVRTASRGRFAVDVTVVATS